MKKQLLGAALLFAAIGGVVVLGAFPAIAAPSHSAHKSDHATSELKYVGETFPGPTCSNPTPVSDTKDVRVPEAASYNGDPVIAKDVIMHNSTGDRVDQYLPPDSWTPNAATPEELAFFAIPAKPSGGDDLTTWDDEWITHWGGIQATPLCDTPSNAAEMTYGEDDSNYPNGVPLRLA